MKKNFEDFEDFLVERNDDLDNAVYDLLCLMLDMSPEDAETLFPWNMEAIGQTEDYIESLLQGFGLSSCHPYYTEDEKSNIRQPCYEGDTCKKQDCPLKGNVTPRPKAPTLSYQELQAYHRQDTMTFHAALDMLFTYGSQNLMRLNLRGDFQPADTNILSPDIQKGIFQLAVELSKVPTRVLMTFVKREMDFTTVPGEVPPAHPFGDAEGICPNCGGEIEYSGENNIDDNGGTHPWSCPECGASGLEGYAGVFDRHYIVRDKDGDLLPGREPTLSEE